MEVQSSEPENNPDIPATQPVKDGRFLSSLRDFFNVILSLDVNSCDV